MNKILSILFMTIATVGLNATANAKKDKDPCKNVKESKDAFTNEIVKTAHLGINGGNGYWEFVLEKKGEAYFLTVIVSQYALNQSAIPAGEKILIKLQNEKLIELQLDADCKPTFRSGGTVVSTWSIKKEFDLKTMRRLCRSAIAAAKVDIQGAELSLATNPEKPKAMEAIMDAAGCIIGEPAEHTDSK